MMDTAARSVQPDAASRAAPSASRQRRRGLQDWQRTVLPVMIGILVGVTIFFFIASAVQLYFLFTSIAQTPEIDLNPAALSSIPGNPSFEQYQAARQQEIVAQMEAFLVERRYHQAAVWLMSSLWMRYLGFVTGMILALVGASFILGKLEESSSKIEGEGPGWRISIISASPGLVLAVLGAVLMLGTILDRDEQTVTDTATYLPARGQPAAAATVTPAAPLLSLPAQYVTPGPPGK